MNRLAVDRSGVPPRAEKLTEQQSLTLEWQAFERDMRLLAPRWLRGRELQHRVPIAMFHLEIGSIG